MTQVLRTVSTPFDAAAWNRQQYTLQRIRTDPGFETYFRSLRLPFDAVTPRDITCGDERIVGPRVTLPGCGILQSDAELEAFSAALRDCGLPLGRLRRHWDCGAEQLSGFTEAQISAGVLRAAKILGVPVGPACQMLPGGAKIGRALIVAGKPKLNSCAFEGIAPYFCWAMSPSFASDVLRYVNLSLAAMPERFSAHDPFVIAIVGEAGDAEHSVATLRSAIAAEPGIRDLQQTGVAIIVGADL